MQDLAVCAFFVHPVYFGSIYAAAILRSPAGTSLLLPIHGKQIRYHLPRHGKCRPIAISFLAFLVINYSQFVTCVGASFAASTGARWICLLHCLEGGIRIASSAELRSSPHMAKFLNLFADPDRVGPCFHGYPYRFQVPKPLVYAGRVGSETTPVDNFTIFVECAVMAPDIPKIDPDRRPDPGAPAWYFRDEVLRMLFHLHSLSLAVGPTCAHFFQLIFCLSEKRTRVEAIGAPPTPGTMKPSNLYAHAGRSLRRNTALREYYR
jgi:hypothetical protein